MSYLVFARKYRPKGFEDVAGQQAVITTLRNAIKSGRIAHAFLFAGPRGVGKTTTARLLARALNCVKGPTAEPCGACDSCLEIAEGRSIDVLEIDGASNRGIDDVKSLRESIQYHPARDRSKVVIIDEVHMLSTPAFNALLKTLEEPPPHAKFIFATTEIHKLPATILSRCQVYEFRRVSFRETVANLADILEREGIGASDEALALIARHADGCLRDAQSALDQAVAFSGKELTEQGVREVLGLVGNDVLFETTAAVLAGDAGQLLDRIERLVDGGTDLRQFQTRLAEHIRNLLVAQVVAEPGPLVALTEADVARLKEQARLLSEEEALRLLNILALGEEELKQTGSPRFTLERTLLRMLQARRLTPLGDLVAALGTAAGSGEPALPPPSPATAAKTSLLSPPTLPAFRPPSPPARAPLAPAAPPRSPAPASATLVPHRPAAPAAPPAPAPAPSEPAPQAPAPARAAEAGKAVKARGKTAHDPALQKIQDLFKAEVVEVDEPS